MKVVLFCGGLGMRLREYSETIPKPMVELGHRPILWHIMKYYAHFGHKEFVLCLGHGGELIKKYFVNYDEYITNDFVLANGGRDINLLNADVADWTITFADTGLQANIGQRLRAVRKYLEGEEAFLANYADGLADLDLSDYLSRFLASGKTASCIAVTAPESSHVLTFGGDARVTSIRPLGECEIWINAGFFAFRKDIFDYIREGEELVEQPFQRLVKKDLLMAQKHRGFWMAMDTFKDKQILDGMIARNNMPWEVWKKTTT
jgi:glucose-1-phosphate cytidylyltransferase